MKPVVKTIKTMNQYQMKVNKKNAMVRNQFRRKKLYSKRSRYYKSMEIIMEFIISVEM